MTSTIEYRNAAAAFQNACNQHAAALESARARKARAAATKKRRAAKAAKKHAPNTAERRRTRRAAVANKVARRAAERAAAALVKHSTATKAAAAMIERAWQRKAAAAEARRAAERAAAAEKLKRQAAAAAEKRAAVNRSRAAEIDAFQKREEERIAAAAADFRERAALAIKIRAAEKQAEKEYSEREKAYAARIASIPNIEKLNVWRKHYHENKKSSRRAYSIYNVSMPLHHTHIFTVDGVQYAAHKFTDTAYHTQGNENCYSELDGVIINKAAEKMVWCNLRTIYNAARKGGNNGASAAVREIMLQGVTRLKNDSKEDYIKDLATLDNNESLTREVVHSYILVDDKDPKTGKVNVDPKTGIPQKKRVPIIPYVTIELTEIGKAIVNSTRENAGLFDELVNVAALEILKYADYISSYGDIWQFSRYVFRAVNRAIDKERSINSRLASEDEYVEYCNRYIETVENRAEKNNYPDILKSLVKKYGGKTCNYTKYYILIDLLLNDIPQTYIADRLNVSNARISIMKRNVKKWYKKEYNMK